MRSLAVAKGKGQGRCSEEREKEKERGGKEKEIFLITSVGLPAAWAENRGASTTTGKT